MKTRTLILTDDQFIAVELALNGRVDMLTRRIEITGGADYTLRALESAQVALALIEIAE